MNRREFIIHCGLSSLLSCHNKKKEKHEINFPITIASNRSVGHLVREAVQLPVTKNLHTDTLVVGGGVAGLAAACHVPHSEVLVCELDTNLGGTSSATTIDRHLYAQGAHYEHAYPDHFGQDTLCFLEHLDIIRFNSKTGIWDFVDTQHIIDPKEQTACSNFGKMQSSVLESSVLVQNFFDLIDDFQKDFTLPTRLLPKNLYALDRISFEQFLAKYLPIDSDFMTRIDYQMRDDYGGTAAQLSALAGIHYYACRPYRTNANISLFSPMQGNYYFIEKMAKQLDPSQLLCNHLVFGFYRNGAKWDIDVLDTQHGIRKKIHARQLIYAGQKHALRYIFSAAYPYFKDISYTPWIVVSLVLDGSKKRLPQVWQNDIITQDQRFLGFTNSAIQNASATQVLTAYYCFPEVHHYKAQDMESQNEILIYETIDKISRYYQQEIMENIVAAKIKIMGHAMPLPKVGYLTAARTSKIKGLQFAGVDTGKLPLLFEALDSGIQAAQNVN